MHQARNHTNNAGNKVLGEKVPYAPGDGDDNSAVWNIWVAEPGFEGQKEKGKK